MRVLAKQRHEIATERSRFQAIKLILEPALTWLWGGFSHLGLIKLNDIISQSEDPALVAEALWEKARWLFFNGEYRAAQRLIEAAINVPITAKGQYYIGLSKCLVARKQYALLAMLLDNPLIVTAVGSRLPYIQANSYVGDGNDEQRIRHINSLYAEQGLTLLQRKTLHKRLNIDNLIAAEPVKRVTDGPLVSVIVPAFNASQQLLTAVESLLAQSWQNIEVIIVDDASDDNTFAIAQQLAAADSRIRVLRNQQNQGAYPTRNNGMRAAQGDYVTVHDSDDWSHPQKLELQISSLQAASAKASVSYWSRVNEDMAFIGNWRLNGQFVEKNHSSLLFERSLLEQVGYWNAVNVSGDTEFIWRLQAQFGETCIVEVLPETPLSLSLVHEQSLTQSKATHVRTINFGLRRLYREAAQIVHSSPDKTCADIYPIGLFRDSPRHFDEVLVADFSLRSEELAAAVDYIKTHARDRALALLHWPRPEHVADTLSADLFKLDLPEDCRPWFLHHGVNIECPTVTLASSEYCQAIPEHLPEISGLQRINSLDNTRDLATETITSLTLLLCPELIENNKHG